MNPKVKKDWEEFKKELTWNNFKIIICTLIPAFLYLYCWIYWYDYLGEILKNKYNHPKTLEEAAITLCILCGMLAPVFFAIWFARLGYWIGKITKFFRDDKTYSLIFDDVSYFIRDMPEEQRQQIKELLSGYKSKLQKRKEAKANQSWLRRNFT